MKKYFVVLVGVFLMNVAIAEMSLLAVGDMTKSLIFQTCP